MEDKVVDLSKTKWGKTRTDGAVDWQRRQKRRMRHHSRLVVLLKVVLPSIAALMVGLVILWPQLKAQHEETFSLIASQSEKLDFPEQQAMVNPRFFTVDEKGEPFNLTAQTAVEIPGDGRRVQLNNINADVLLEGEKWYALDAQTGIYSQADDTMELLDQVNVYTENGYEAETTQALINMKNRDIIGNRKTRVRTPAGYADAEGFSILENGTVLKLNGRTRAVFYPERKEK